MSELCSYPDMGYSPPMWPCESPYSEDPYLSTSGCGDYAREFAPKEDFYAPPPCMPLPPVNSPLPGQICGNHPRDDCCRVPRSGPLPPVYVS